MKPLGLTYDFRIRKPTRTEDAIWNAVETAIEEGWTPQDFVRELRSAWGDVLREQARHADAELAKAIP